MRRPTHRKHDPNWVPGPKAWRRRNGDPPTARPLTVMDILKTLYPQNGDTLVTPRWARQCYARHWMTWAQMKAVPLEPCGYGIRELMYDKFPMFQRAG